MLDFEEINRPSISDFINAGTLGLNSVNWLMY